MAKTTTSTTKTGASVRFLCILGIALERSIHIDSVLAWGTVRTPCTKKRFGFSFLSRPTDKHTRYDDSYDKYGDCKVGYGSVSLNAKTRSMIDCDDDDTPQYYPAREWDEGLAQADNRPGAIIETEEQLAIKERMFREVEDGTRQYPVEKLRDYGVLEEDEDAEYDNDDPNAIDAETLGVYTIQDLKQRLEYEWDPLVDQDPNKLALQQEGVTYWKQPKPGEKDLDGKTVTEDDILYDPVFGPANPVDERTIMGTMDSYVIDERTRDESKLTPQFEPDDIEIAFNEEFVEFRKSLDILDTYVDEFLPEDLPVPRHVAKWYGYPEQTHFEPKNFTNNRFTENPTDFDSMTPHRARELAVEMARAKNAEWLPDGVSQEWHMKQREPYEKFGTLAGTLRKGECDPELVDLIQPALQIFGSCADLLSIKAIDNTIGRGTPALDQVTDDDDDQNEDGETVNKSLPAAAATSSLVANQQQNNDLPAIQYIFRFEYHGLMKNRFGMQCWMEKLIAQCGVDVSSVIFETGFRKRDFAYEGGDAYNGPLYW